MTRNKKYQLILCIVLSMILLSACTQEEKWDMHWEQSSGNAFQSMDVSASLPDTQIVRAATTRKKQSTGIKGDYLLKTNWHQHYPFNKALPMINGRRVVAGCVNIALAQIMYYYHYPLQGNGVVHHSWKGQYFTAVLNRRLYWNKMPLTITPDTPNYAIDELAALIRDISMINQTLFGSGPYEQSGAAFDMNQFVFHFGYSREIQQTSSNNPEFFHIIDHEIEARRPVLISIHGQPIDHMAIIDGKTVHNGQTCYHVNMGWGGQHNRFYDLSRPITLESISDQRSIGQTYRFTGHMTLYYPIKPCDKKTCSSNNLEPHDHVSGNQIQGQFDFRTDKDRYENILLKDTTVIQGDRGYANQAFYIEIYDQFHQLLSSSAPDSKAIQHDFDPGIYHFTVSLCQSNQQSMHCYELKPGYAQYTIRISTGVITPDEKHSIANDIGPPIITNESTDIILPRNFTKHIIRMDAFHPMGLPVALSVASDTKSPGIDAYMNDHFLIITNQHQGHLKSTKLSVTAHTNGIRTQADFNIMFSGQRVWFGKTIDIPGEFKNQESQNIHRLILEDRCRLTGYNGFMNQAFYMQIMDKQGKRIVGPNDGEIDRYFDRGIYHIQTSLKIERRQQTQGSQKISTRYYEYQKGLGDQYVIHVYCPDVNYDLDLLAQDNTDSPPQFQKKFPPLILSSDFRSFSIPVDVIDADGDPIQIAAVSDHFEIKARAINNRLNIIPNSPSVRTKAEITITATANNKQTKTSFYVFVAKQRVDLGTDFEIKGIFSDQSNINRHPVILSGHCRVSGFNGFKNQAFFIEILDNNQQVIMPASDYAIENYYNGLYYIQTRLKAGKRYFPYISGQSDQYSVSVSCPDSYLDKDYVENVLWTY